MRLSRVQHNRSDKDAIKLLCLFHRRRLSPPFSPLDILGMKCVRTFVSRDRNWIKNIGIKTHNKCNIICIRVRLLTAGLRGGGGVLFAGPSGSSTSRSFSRGFLGVCVSLSSTKLLMETNL